jgi:putative PIN family toxin of toxin-antitoxin system
VRLVIDTDVLVAAFRSDQGASRRLLLAALEGEFVVLLSVPLMLEYESVLKRQEHLSAAGLAENQVDAVLDALAAVGQAVRLAFHWRPALGDPGDEMVLETAVNGQADILVTFNVKHFCQAAERFGFQVGRPGEVWKQIRRGSHEKK